MKEITNNYKDMFPPYLLRPRSSSKVMELIILDNKFINMFAHPCLKLIALHTGEVKNGYYKNALYN